MIIWFQHNNRQYGFGTNVNIIRFGFQPFGSGGSAPIVSTGGGGPEMLPDKYISLINMLMGRYRKRRILAFLVDPPT